LFLSREYSKQFSSRQAALNGSGSTLFVASTFGEIHPELIWIIRGIRKEEPLAGYEILEVIFFFLEKVLRYIPELKNEFTQNRFSYGSFCSRKNQDLNSRGSRVPTPSPTAMYGIACR
jgi:hypothetical protein